MCFERSTTIGAKQFRAFAWTVAAANDPLLEMQSIFSGVSVERPTELEPTARGAAMLAGLGAGVFRDGGDSACRVGLERSFEAIVDETLEKAFRERGNTRWAARVL
jgi:glycerol kinase